MTGEKCRLNEVVISIESLHSVIEINSLFCFAQTLSVPLAAPKLRTLGKMKEKQCFPFILRSFIRTFGCAEVTDTRQKKEKLSFPFILRSFIRNFGCAEVTDTRQNERKTVLSFHFALVYS